MGRAFSDTTLPDAYHALIPLAKLADYSLSQSNTKGKHKARVFRSALGLAEDDAEWLRTEVAAAVLETGAVEQEPGEYGARRVVDFELSTDVGSATVRTTWIVRNDETFPRLTSCYVL